MKFEFHTTLNDGSIFEKQPVMINVTKEEHNAPIGNTHEDPKRPTVCSFTDAESIESTAMAQQLQFAGAWLKQDP